MFTAEGETDFVFVVSAKVTNTCCRMGRQNLFREGYRIHDNSKTGVQMRVRLFLLMDSFLRVK